MGKIEEGRFNFAVIDSDKDNRPAVCPFNSRCTTLCMLMRYTAFGDPCCSLRVIADELVEISTSLKNSNRRHQ